jgi:1,4-dihydroxy-2-naphthoate octaprenyltransferase
VSIALVWAISSVLFPLQGSMQDSQVWFEFAQRFFLIMALVIPFDIRDLNNDELHIQTLPQKLGVANSKKVGIIFLVFFFMIGFIKSPLTGTSVLSTLFVFVISLLLLTKSKENRSLYYASFWVEGVPILWLFCIWGLKWFLQ